MFHKLTNLFCFLHLSFSKGAQVYEGEKTAPVKVLTVPKTVIKLTNMAYPESEGKVIK